MFYNEMAAELYVKGLLINVIKGHQRYSYMGFDPQNFIVFKQENHKIRSSDLTSIIASTK